MRRRRCLLLSGTALSLGAAFALAGSPAALADCVTANSPVEITCGDTTTTTENTYNLPNSRNHQHDDHIVAKVEDGATVDGYGLRFETWESDGTIQMTHEGDAVILTEAGAVTGSLLFGPGALELNGNGGLVSYTGSGEVSNNTLTGAGILITNLRSGSVLADVSGDVIGPSGIVVSLAEENVELFLLALEPGDIEIDVAAGVTVTGLTGSGIHTETAVGTTTIDNAGLIQGDFAGISGGPSTVQTIVNHGGGIIRNRSGEPGHLAISGHAATNIDNEIGGIIIGQIETGGDSDTFTNSGLWRTTGDSNFGGGSNVLLNQGRITVAEQAAEDDITRFIGLESFTNAQSGVIDMVDDNAPGVHDELTIGGLYKGVQGSKIELDLALMAGDPQSGSDLLILDALTSAEGTSDLLFNIVSTSVTATTENSGRALFSGGQQLAAPVTVVKNHGDLTTSSGDDNIPLARSGLVNYDLVSNGEDFQVVSEVDGGITGGILLPVHATLAVAAFTTQRTPNPITATCIDPENKPNAQGGWARLFGAEFDTDTKGKAVVNGKVSKIESENRTRFGILQGGFDHVLCNLDGNGGNLHLGVTVGKIWGSARQTDPNPGAGIFGTDIDFDTFFIGPYAAYTRGDLAIQTALRFDRHSLDLSNPTVGLDADSIEFDASAVTGTASISHDFKAGELTLTPEIGVNVSNTKIDEFGIAGGRAVLDDLWSVIGHAGVTARTNIAVSDNVFVIPFASATLYHEFVEDADAQMILGPTTVDVGANRVGTFGQFGLGANAVRLGDVVAGRPTLFGGARIDVQVGERIEGVTASVFGRIQF